MNNLQTPHLTEDELDEVLLGFASEDATRHVAVCEPCGVRIEAFRNQMAVFNHASMAWSEARSNTISRDIATHKPTPRLTLTTVWSSAATLVVALAFGLTTILHQVPVATDLKAASPDQAVIAAHPDHDQNELASDNEMLAAINSEFGAPRPAQLGIYENTRTHASDTRPAIPLQVRE
jgi:hypothetical protein